jgi:hypothetical protein
MNVDHPYRVDGRGRTAQTGDDDHVRDMIEQVLYTVQGALQLWLGELIRVDAVDVESEDATLRVTVRYMVRRSQQSRTDTFSRGVGA